MISCSLCPCPREESCRLNEFNMFMEILRNTILQSSDNTFTRFFMSPAIVCLSAILRSELNNAAVICLRCPTSLQQGLRAL